MSSKLTQDLLLSVAGEVLEEAAFLFTEPTQEPPPWPGPVVEVHLSFEGPEKGVLVLASSQDLCAELAANLLGIEPDDPDAAKRGGDALGETLNIVGGALMAAAFGADGSYQIGIPAAQESDPGDYERRRDSAGLAACLIDEEERRIDLLVWPD